MFAHSVLCESAVSFRHFQKVLFKVGNRHRFGEIVALEHAASHFRQHAVLFFGFHPFRECDYPKLIRQVNDIAEDGPSPRFFGGGFDKHHIDLDDIDRHVLEHVEGRIAAAGCLLPLTRRSDVDANLGTRHRAAMGISEISDSIAIVVSEETGIISVAYDYTLTREYTPDGLKKFLMKKLLKSDKGENDN